MRPCFYSNTITSFISSSHDEIFGSIARNSDFPDEVTQKAAWNQQINILKDVLRGRQNDEQDAVILTKGGNPASETNGDIWADGRYYPTPTIIEAAMSLYGGHTVDEIARTDAGAVNLSATTED